ncbi:hypothetical protein PHLCEN_2v7322 [Hermanssonia centrifuga]|uniref:Uncharacterized protein n=1 Tax=Hermanssonia centrifuga TaxID=98765 RepID=A0A2R6NWQ7_9APHY|nr:hypothetical protein PHLCEN_2v7322 [Hermanssonia centrifuga]
MFGGAEPVLSATVVQHQAMDDENEDLFKAWDIVRLEETKRHANVHAISFESFALQSLASASALP